MTTKLSPKCSKCGAAFSTIQSKIDHDVSRNITKQERLAMLVWGKRYAQSGQSARCFLASLHPEDRKQVKRWLIQIVQASDD